MSFNLLKDKLSSYWAKFSTVYLFNKNLKILLIYYLKMNLIN